MRNLRDSYRALRELIGSERWWRWPLLLALALTVTGFEAAGALLVFILLGLVAAPDTGLVLPVVGDLAARFPSRSLRELQIGFGVTTAGFFLLRFVVLTGRSYVQNRLVHNAGALVAGRLLHGYLAMPYLLHTRRNPAELLRNAFDGTQQLVSQVLKPLVELTAEAILVIGMTVVLLVMSPMATGLALIVLGPSVLLLQRVVQPRLRRLGRRAQDGRRASIASVQRSLGGIRDIRLLGRERAFSDAHLAERLQLSRATHLSQTLKELPRTLIETALVLAIVAAFMITLLRGTEVAEALSTLGLFAYAGLRLQPSLQKIVAGLNQLRFSSAVVEDLTVDHRLIQGWLTRDDQRMEAGLGTPRDLDGTSFADRIHLESVSFSYDGGRTTALRDVDLTIERGEFVGICGSTGGGKSTLVDLLVGLLEPTSGSITVDGRELGAEPRWWWSQLGVVSQQVFLIDDTVRANIAFGERPGDVDEARLWRCIRRAQLADVVGGMPDGLDTVVGERGIRLSGGQRQRVAIARALYPEPAVLVFDEGTSALDAATEAALVAALDEAKEGRTLLAVAHRIATVRDADRIVVVDGGRVVDQGRYDDLLERSPLFRSLAR